MRLIDGGVKPGERIQMMVDNQQAEVLEVGVFAPRMTLSEGLLPGEVGYIATGLKDVREPGRRHDHVGLRISRPPGRSLATRRPSRWFAGNLPDRQR